MENYQTLICLWRDRAMRHKKGNKKLNMPTDQRLALLKSLVRSLFLNNSIKTTDTRAKQAKKIAEKLITLGKNGSIHSRRLALSILPDKIIIGKIFSEYSEKFKQRKGGYTRVIKLGYRRGDSALISLLEFVD